MAAFTFAFHTLRAAVRIRADGLANPSDDFSDVMFTSVENAVLERATRGFHKGGAQ
jgi:hypothetical protein